PVAQQHQPGAGFVGVQTQLLEVAPEAKILDFGNVPSHFLSSNCIRFAQSKCARAGPTCYFANRARGRTASVPVLVSNMSYRAVFLALALACALPAQSTQDKITLNATP